MTERESFVAAMRDNHADDTPRLAFADWLQERDEHDRAELIRVQVARARLNPRPRLRIVSGFERRYRPATVDYRPESRKGEIARAVLGFEGEFEFPVGAMIRPGVCFDAIEPRAEWNPDAPERIRAVGCVVERLNPPLYASEYMGLEGHITGIPCPVRPEADALDERAAALMLKIPFGDFCPATFGWLVDEQGFNTPVRESQSHAPHLPAPAVLVRHGFAEHVRCSWEDWLRWADWFRANHPCERVTLTTTPQWEFQHDDGAPTVFARWKGGGRMAKVAMPAEALRHTRHGSLNTFTTQEFCREQWPGTSFGLSPELAHVEAIPPFSDEFNQYTAQLHTELMQGLGIPPDIANGGN